MVARARKQVRIDPGQDALLKLLAEGMGTSKAEIVREAVDRHVRSLWLPKRHVDAWEAERAFLMRLVRQGAVPGQRTWQREDLHER